jgi:hypothetical protein
MVQTAVRGALIEPHFLDSCLCLSLYCACILLERGRDMLLNLDVVSSPDHVAITDGPHYCAERSVELAVAIGLESGEHG